MNYSLTPERVDGYGDSLRATSPNRLRIKQLSEKLTGLHAGMESEVQARKDAVELRLKVYSR